MEEEGGLGDEPVLPKFGDSFDLISSVESDRDVVVVKKLDGTSFSIPLDQGLGIEAEQIDKIFSFNIKGKEEENISREALLLQNISMTLYVDQQEELDVLLEKGKSSFHYHVLDAMPPATFVKDNPENLELIPGNPSILPIRKQYNDEGYRKTFSHDFDGYLDMITSRLKNILITSGNHLSRSSISIFHKKLDGMEYILERPFFKFCEAFRIASFFHDEDLNFENIKVYHQFGEPETTSIFLADMDDESDFKIDMFEGGYGNMIVMKGLKQDFNRYGGLDKLKEMITNHRDVMFKLFFFNQLTSEQTDSDQFSHTEFEFNRSGTKTKDTYTDLTSEVLNGFLLKQALSDDYGGEYLKKDNLAGKIELKEFEIDLNENDPANIAADIFVLACEFRSNPDVKKFLSEYSKQRIEWLKKPEKIEFDDISELNSIMTKSELNHEVLFSGRELVEIFGKKYPHHENLVMVLDIMLKKKALMKPIYMEIKDRTWRDNREIIIDQVMVEVFRIIGSITYEGDEFPLIHRLIESLKKDRNEVGFLDLANNGFINTIFYL